MFRPISQLTFRLNTFKSQASFTKSASVKMDLDSSLSRTVKFELRQVLNVGLSSVMPSIIIKQKVHCDGDRLVVNSVPYPLTENVYLVGFGKAVAGMAYDLIDLLGPRLKRGILSVPVDSSGKGPNLDSASASKFQEIREQELQQLQMLKRSKAIDYLEGGRNNQPDDASYANTKSIIELVQGLGKDDTLIALISGGGSALLFAPKPPMSSEEKRDLCKRLQNAGANITELNAVRKEVSMVKGGGLAKLAYPAKMLSLIISDVVGDPLDVIASGPTCSLAADNRTESIGILKKYKLYQTVSEEVRREIFEKVTYEDTSLVENGSFKFVDNLIIGNNESALKASAEAAKNFDVEGVILSSAVEGDVREVSVAYAKVVKTICRALDKSFLDKEDFIAEILRQNVESLKLDRERLEKAYETLVTLREGKAVLLLAGGEPTVVVEGDGKGGRNQELALQFSLDWLSEIAKQPELSRYFVQFLSAATDGQDGPTDAAGAFGQPGIRPKMTKMIQGLKDEKKKTDDPEKLKIIDDKIREITWMLPENALRRNDSYNFYSKYEKGQNLLKTGLTGTNVMDLHYVYLKKRDCECDIPGVVKTDAPVEVDDFLFDESKDCKNE